MPCAGTFWLFMTNGVIEKRGNSMLSLDNPSIMSWLLAGALGGVAMPGLAAEDSSDISFVIGLGAHFGGDELGEFIAIDDDDDEDDVDVKAGEGVSFSAGVDVPIGSSPFSVSLMGSYIVGGLIAKENSVDYDRFAIDLLGHYAITQHHVLGAGLVFHLSPEYDASDVTNSDDDDIEFDNATGFAVEYMYKSADSFGIGLRYTKVEYETSDGRLLDGDDEFSGDNVSLQLRYFW